MRSSTAELLMLSVTLAWGASYLLMKEALAAVEPFNLMALRFGLAFLVMGLLFGRSLIRHFSWYTLKVGSLYGLLLYLVFFGMITGTDLTTASAAAFLTSTTVILVPLMECVLKKCLPTWGLLLSVIAATAGLYLLTVKDGFSMDAGALFCLMGAWFYALYIIVVDKIKAPQEQLLPVLIVQLGVTALLGFITSAIVEEPVLPTDMRPLAAIIALGLLCSAYGFVVQPIAQRYTGPEKIGLIFSFEPVFAAILSFLFLGEILNAKEYCGMILIFCAVMGPKLITYLKSLGRKQRSLKAMSERAKPGTKA